MLVLFLIPIFICSFIFKNKTIFFENSKPLIIYLTDKDLSLDLNDYLVGVVGGEMPALFQEEALKAQAIAARSYVLSKKSGQNIVTITSTISDQIYLTNYELKEKWGSDYEKYYHKIHYNVYATDRYVIKRENKILKTYYFSMSNGYTEDSQTVFNEKIFTSTISPFEESLSNFINIKILTIKEFKGLLNISTNKISIDKIERSDTNRVKQIYINDTSYTGIELRKLLGLRSTDFEFEINDSEVKIITRGYGHGVGMSQYGANEMAKNGKKANDILYYYYNDIKIEKI